MMTVTITAVIVVSLVTAVYGVKCARRYIGHLVWQHHANWRAQCAAEQRQTQQRHAMNQQRRELNRRGAKLQIALMQLDQAPDFQRAAFWANQCRDLPLEFRQRQYRRFHSAMVAHLARCLRAGAAADQLMQGLRDVLQHLGVAAFEADYMLGSVQGKQPKAPDSITEFERQITSLQQDHERRMQILQRLSNVSDDIREQLIEAEERRFQQSLFGRDR